MTARVLAFVVPIVGFVALCLARGVPVGAILGIFVTVGLVLLFAGATGWTGGL